MESEFVIEIMTPANAGNEFHFEETFFEIISAEEVHEVHGSVGADIHVVDGCGATFGFDGIGVVKNCGEVSCVPG